VGDGEPEGWCPLGPRSAQPDRRSGYYAPVVTLAEVIPEGTGAVFEQDEALPLPGFLFNMDRLFERFVARLCREHAPPGLRVETQESSSSAYLYRANPHRWLRPRLRPDLMVRDAGGRAVLVLDTKYKILAGIPPAPGDLYQLTLYSMSFGRGTFVPARIIFPCVGSVGEKPVLDFYGLRTQVLASISLVGLNLQACANALRHGDRPPLHNLVNELLAV
jgi:5-methylcytosine-specific restriction enzyme subunit McrC